jgi:para-nitrobenzyl esterase
MFHANFADRQELVMSEDCLYLNISTPDPSASAGLPVLVWVHGGGNRYGYGSQDIHDPRNLTRRGIVVVTLNYRLGALGFLAHPGLSREDAQGASGNYGLMDIIAALRWVAGNVTAFGGDPGRVTLAGNSAGAALICHLMGSPAARGLFHRAIGQSSSGFDRAEGGLPARAEAEARGVAFADSLKVPDLATLRQVSGLELTSTGHFGPVVDGRALTRDTQHAFASGEQAPVPVLVGSNRDEGSVYTQPGAAAELAAQALASADAAFDHVYPTGNEADRHRSARMYTGDTRFVWPVWRWAVTHAKTAPAPAWVYRFEREPPLPPDIDLAPPPDGGDGYGVFHSAELPYMWDNLHVRPWPWEPADYGLAQIMADAWVRFVKTGDPNGEGLPPWPPLASETDPVVMRFAERSGPAAPYRLAAMRFLDAGRLKR